MNNIYQNLNDKQQEAVFYIKGPLLILAGAGSGKTRVLMHRIAYLIENGVSPFNIMAITPKIPPRVNEPVSPINICAG